jgi:hypothetical protein
MPQNLHSVGGRPHHAQRLRRSRDERDLDVLRKRPDQSFEARAVVRDSFAAERPLSTAIVSRTGIRIGSTLTIFVGDAVLGEAHIFARQVRDRLSIGPERRNDKLERLLSAHHRGPDAHGRDRHCCQSTRSRTSPLSHRILRAALDTREAEVRKLALEAAGNR